MSFVQGNNAGAGQSSSGGTPNTYSLAFTTQNCAAGNMLVFCARMNASTTVTGISDDEGNTWQVVGPIANDIDLYFGYALNIVGGTKASVKVTFSGTGVIGGISPCIAEYSGVNTFRASDAGNTGTGDNSTSAAVTAAAGDLLIGYMADVGGQSGFAAGTIGAGAGNLQESSGVGGNIYAALADGTASAGSNTAGFTSAVSTAWAAGVSAFYELVAASGGGGVQGFRNFVNKKAAFSHARPGRSGR